MKNKLAKTLLLCLLSLRIVAQHDEFTPGGHMDTVFDRMGTKIAVKDMEIIFEEGGTSGGSKPIGVPASVNNALTCTAGIFKVYFANNCGMAQLSNPVHVQRRQVVCEVLWNLSGLLNGATWPSTVHVKILIDSLGNIVNSPSTSFVAGVATPFFAVPANPGNPNPGLIENLVTKTIKSKIDAWTNVLSPIAPASGSNGFYHGRMAFNFENLAFTWHSNIGSLCPASAGFIDLYTVVLHEATHFLGFASLIGPSGFSVFGPANNYYDRYDQFLKDGNNVPLLASTNTCMPNTYGLYFNSSASMMAPNCTSNFPNDVTTCSTACKYVSFTNTNMPVYTPACFQPGSSLSHFEDMCYPANSAYGNNLYFVMSNATSVSMPNKRFLKQEEKNVLCDLGYTVTNTYTSNAVSAATVYAGGTCSQTPVWGLNDGISSSGYAYTALANNPVTIPISAVIANDYTGPNPVVMAACVETVYAVGTVTVTAGNIVFTPNNNFFGPFMLRYIPTNSLSMSGNVTYIYGFIYPANCGPANACDMVQNKGFENHVSCGFLNTNANTGVSLNCWLASSLNPDLLIMGCVGSVTNSPANLGTNTFGSNPTFASPYSTPTNTAVIGLGAFAGSVEMTFGESIANFLGSPVQNNQAYTLSFWAYQYSGTKSDPFNALTQTVNPTGMPVVLSFATSTVFATGTQNYPFAGITPIVSATLSNVMNQWRHYTVTFTSTASGSILYAGVDKTLAFNYLTGIYGINAVTGTLFYTLLDDVSLRPANVAPQLTIPSLICNGQSLMDLSQYVNLPGGVFNGSGITTTVVSTSNGTVTQYNFNENQNLGNALYTIAYTYTDNLGCTQTAIKQVTIGAVSNNMNLVFAGNPIGCVNGGTLSVVSPTANYTYTWQPGNVTGLSYPVSPSVTTTYSAYGSGTGTCSMLGTISVVPLQPYISIGLSSPSVCPGNSIQLSASGNFTTILWQPGNFVTPTVVITPTGAVTFTVSGYNQFGCPVSSVITIPSYTTPISPVATPSAICAGGGSTLSAAGGLAYATPTWSAPAVTGYSTSVLPSATTVYTLTIPVNTLCAIIKTVEVTVTNFSISFPSNVNCPGSVSTVTAAGNYTAINWQPGNATGNTFTVLIGSLTVYSATASFSNGCVVTKTFQVVPPFLSPDYMMVSSLPLVCPGNTTTLTLSGWPSYTAVTWSPGGYTVNPVVVSPTVTTQYTINLTTVQGCTMEVVKTLSVSNACCTGGNAVSFLSQPSSTLAGGSVVNFNLVVPAGYTLTMTGPVIFAPNVSVLVSGVLKIDGAHLYSCTDMWDGISLYGGKLFSLPSPVVGNLIEDAKTAIAIDAGMYNGWNGPQATYSILPAGCYISNTIFNKNNVGIRLTNFPIKNTTNFNFSINSSIFTCRALNYNSNFWAFPDVNGSGLRVAASQGPNALTTPYTALTNYTVVNLKAPYNYRTSLAGIVLESVGTTGNNASQFSALAVGDATTGSGFNIFDSQSLGIDAHNSNLASYNNVFQLSQYNATVTTLCAGIRSVNDMYAYNPSNVNQFFLHEAKLDLVSPLNPTVCVNRFYDCHAGIYASGLATLNVQYASFASSQGTASPSGAAFRGFKGIHIISPKYDSYKLLYNGFYNVNVGVDCYMQPNYIYTVTGSTSFFQGYGERWGTFDCMANFFGSTRSQTAPLSSGFMAHGIRISATLKTLSNNTIQPTFYGLSPNNGLNISYNNFDRVWCGAYVGAMASNGYTKTIEGNTFRLANNPVSGLPIQWGVKTEMDKYMIVKTNTIVGTNNSYGNNMTGVYSGQNLSSAMVCNSVVTLPRGFELAGSHSPYLIWNGNFMNNNGYGMYGTSWGTSASTNGGFGIGSQGGATTPRDNRWEGSQWDGSSYYQTYSDNNTNVGNSPYTGKALGSTSPAYVYSINPSFNNGQLATNSYWNLSYSSASNVTNTPSSCNPTLTAFACQNCNPPPTGENVEEEEGDGVEIASFLLYMNLDMDSVLLANSDTLLEWYNTNEPLERGRLVDIENNLAAGRFSTAQTLLDGFDPQNNVQDRFKQYFQLYLTYRLGHDSLNEADSAALGVLASQCPFSDGPAVYKARSLYDLAFNAVSMYNDEGCVPPGYSLRQVQPGSPSGPSQSELKAAEANSIYKKRRKGNFYKLYPNPASNFVTLLSSSPSESLELSVLDALGREVMRQQVQVSNYRAGLNLDLMNGLYTVKLSNGKTPSAAFKLVITK